MRGLLRSWLSELGGLGLLTGDAIRQGFRRPFERSLWIDQLDITRLFDDGIGIGSLGEGFGVLFRGSAFALPHHLEDAACGGAALRAG